MGGRVPKAASTQQRSCSACRVQGARPELLRFVLGPEGELVFDGHGKLPGRGAYTCPDPSCVRRAVERRGFDRSFRRSVRAIGGPQALLARIGEWLQGHALNLLGLARRAGLLHAGGDEVERAIEQGKVKLLVLAVDLSPRRGLELQVQAERGEVPVLRIGTMETLGHAIGRPPTGVLGVAEGPQLGPLLRTAARISRFGGAMPGQGPGTLDESRLEA